MPATSNIIAAALGLGLAVSAVWAQEAETPPTEAAPAPSATPADEPAADPAAPVEPTAPAQGEAAPAEGEAPAGAPADAQAAEPGAGEVLEIVRETFGDWEIRCLPDETECFMYQLALDGEENPVAEVSILKLPDPAEAAAGVTVVTPLGTLLTEGLVLQVDGGEARQYPFAFCSQIGCFARFGLTDETVAELKRGRAGRMRLVSVAAPAQPVELDLSLTGFTAAFDALAVPAAPAAPATPAAPAASTAPAAPAEPAAPTEPAEFPPPVDPAVSE